MAFNSYTIELTTPATDLLLGFVCVIPIRNYNLALALYLASNFSNTVAPLQAAVRLKSNYSPAHYYLTMVYWNLKLYAPVLASVHRVQDLGMPAARSVVETLSASQPRTRQANVQTSTIPPTIPQGIWPPAASQSGAEMLRSFIDPCYTALH